VDNGLVIEVDPGRFEEMVASALDGLPEELGPDEQRHRHGRAPRGRPVCWGSTRASRSPAGQPGTPGSVRPDRITIYRQAICSICQTGQEVADQVRQTVIHEIGHHFGIDDKSLRELGW
jgi:predicted Zn-dependent protease with MMP-like domain